MPRLLLTVPEAAEALAISRSKLYELLASGAIASIRIDGSRRIPLTALEEYVSRLLTERTAPDACNQPQEHAPAPRWRHEARHHLVLRDPRQGPRDGHQQTPMGRRLRDRARRQGRTRRGPGEGPARRVHRPQPDHRGGIPG